MSETKGVVLRTGLREQLEAPWWQLGRNLPAMGNWAWCEDEYIHHEPCNPPLGLDV